MAKEAGDATFVSKLDDAEKRKAREELNEINDKDREIAVQTLRKWALEQHWLKTPTDFEFLLRFIRVRKYSQLGARETLENYWTNKTKYPEWFKNIDPADEKLQKVIRSGVFLCPRAYDRHGRRFFFSKIGGFDFSMLKTKEGQNTMYKAAIMLYEWLATDETVQVNGLVAVSDYTNMSIDILKIWNPENKKKLMGYFQKSLPIRFKGFHLYNEPTFFDAMYAIIAPFMRQKFKDRMFMHGKSLVKIYEEIGMSVLPEEYLPDDYDGPSAGSVKEITEQMIEDMMKPEFRNYMIETSSGNYMIETSSGNYVIETSSGNYVIETSSGNYVIETSSGNYVIETSSGNYVIETSSGNYVIETSSGNYVIETSSGNYVIETSSGNYVIETSSGNYVIETSSGNYVIETSSGNYVIETSSGNYVIETSSGNYVIETSSGNYVIETSSGKYVIETSSGNYVIETSSGNYMIETSSGNYMIETSSGNYMIETSSGKYMIETSSGNYMIETSSGNYMIETSSGNYMIETSSGNYMIETSSGNYMIETSSGNYMIETSSGNYMIETSSGNYMIETSSGNYMIETSSGNYMIETSSGKYGVDLEKRKSADKPPEASFRKLNFD